MAAQDFITRQKAKSISQAFQLAQESAINQYGNDPYNGTISTCIGWVDVTKEFKQSTLDKMSFIEKKMEDANKRQCFVITELEPLANSNKIKTTVENTVIKGTSKWELRYNVYTGWEDRQVGSCKTKTDAIKLAREHTEKTNDTTFVRMEKLLIGQNPNVAVVRYKNSSQEREGSYVLFGLAAC